jgi:hypothetical protein
MRQFLRTQFNIYIKYIYADGDRNLLVFILTKCEEDGIKVITSPPYTPKQNLYSKRSSAIIILRARAILVQASLPKYIWPKAVNSAIYIIN